MKLDLNKISFADFDVLYKSGIISDAEVAAAKAAVGSNFDFNFWGLTLGDIGQMMEGKVPDGVIELFRIQDISASEFLRRNGAFERFAESFCDIVAQFTIEPSGDEKMASIGLPVFNKHEGFLVFARQHFGLKNYTEAENITLGDFYLAKKESYIQKMFEKNMQSLIKSKSKK